jgi:SAM-dependent methyltransferase
MTGPTVDEAIAAYDRLAGELAPRYAAAGADRFIKRHAGLLPPPPGPVLDIGAGSGVHAAGLAGHGYRVVAVEPSAGMRVEAARLFPGTAVEWVDDRLPGLQAVRARGERFAFILVNAVWMHVPPEDRDAACAALAELAAPGAVLSMALRQGPSPADRPMHDCDPDLVAAELARHDFEEIGRSLHDGGAAGPGASFVRLNLRRVRLAAPSSARQP